MKFTCTKNDFNNGISIALKAVPGKTTMPILECVVIEAKGDSIILTTNDMQLGIETKVPAEVKEEGIILVNARMIADIVRRFPEEDVHFEVDENNSILLFCGKSKFNIPGIDHEEFPMLPQIEVENEITLSQFTLKEMIRKTIFSISDNESNKIITGELFEIKGTEFKVVSLDLVRVSICKIQLKESYDHIKVVIPGKTLNEISKILSGDAEEEVKISFSKNHVLFEFGDTMIISRLIEGNYYNIEQMLKNNYETQVKVNKKEFYGCIDRATLLLREAEKNPVILHINDEEIQMEMNTNIGSMDEEVYIEKEGKDLDIALNPKYIIDVLKVIDDEDIYLYLFNSNAPCVIKNKEESYIYLITPIYMN